jgi:23S rRNA pseudouridine1911/1915/1917 synthase
MDIVYEDDTLLLINKSQEWLFILDMEIYWNFSCMPYYHFDNLPMNSSERPGLVHRIDKDTSGLLVIAKTEVRCHICKQFEAKTSERNMWLCVGNVVADEGLKVM